MKNSNDVRKVFLQIALVATVFGITSFRLVDNSTKDQVFVDRAARVSLEEITLGELALQKSTANEVKELGKMMAQSHRQSLNDLTTLTKKKLITVPSTPPQSTYEAYKNLNGKSASNFDKAYCAMVISGHKNAIVLFENASKDSSDTTIREWAMATLPILQKHLDHAVTCQMKCEKIQGRP